MMLQNKHNEKEQLRDDLFFFKTVGFSMWPYMKPDERLIFKKVPPETLRIGDIVLYKANNQTICHRLVRKIGHREEQLLYVRGDNSTSSPELITKQMFLGKAIAIIRDGKAVSLTTKRRWFINRVIVTIAPLVSVGLRIGKVMLRNK